MNQPTAGTLLRRVWPPLRRLLRGPILFELLFLLMALGFLLAATNPRFRNESLPLIIASLSAAFIMLAIVWRLAGRLAATEEREAAWREQLSEGAGQQGAQQEEPAPWFGFLLAVVYLGSFFGLVFGFGMYIGVPAFLLGFLVLHGKLPWQATALIFVLVGLGLPLIFRLAFNLTLWVGAIPELVGGWVGGGYVPPL